MGGAAVHPSQRRFSCECCRKIKARCQRLYANNSKCVRCTLLDLDCIVGQQKRVGRPRRAATADAEADKHRKNLGSTLSNQQVTPAKVHNHVANPTTSHENPSNKEGNHQNWGINFLMDTPMAALVPTNNETYSGAQVWPAVDMNSFDQNFLAWDTPNDLDRNFFLSNNESTFSSASSSASPLNTPPSTVSSPAGSNHGAEENISETLRSPLIRSITTSDAMAELSKINLDLHTRMVAVDANRAALDFNGIVYEKGPLFIENLTLAQFLLKASQDLKLILRRIVSSRTARGMSYSTQTTETNLLESLTISSQAHLGKPRDPTSFSSSSSSPAPEILFAPLALTITSIFTQLITLCELNIELMNTRIAQIATNPVVDLPGLSLGSLPVSEPCIQGIVFCEIIAHIMEGIEQALGLNSVSGVSGTGLFSARQKDVLWSELDGKPGIIPGHGVMRPINVRKAFGRLAVVLRQISMDQLVMCH
ncbi:putative c6 zinc finger domain-containing protein [Botrytis fragariae]|uniref:Putative c6 zinc finger domain-containing protein n=1 Tax=Botrytis fragariae TaxID=1964551 RepID=A0A8H6EF26_9HELO|nr:putative c6 zinc finger domain-containing protein [Botrytis fragariae]KAF5869535.1 putative c6 zinc finger domain-containing protein [Botrytis fragariae]